MPAESEVDVYVEEATISSEKVEEIPVNDINDVKRLCGYRFMDFDILSAVFKGLNAILMDVKVIWYYQKIVKIRKD